MPCCARCAPGPMPANHGWPDALAPEIQAEEELLGFQCQLSPDRVGDSGYAALRQLGR